MNYRQRMLEVGLDMAKSGKYVCPVCSHERKNKADRCLSVTFEDDGVIYNCHNVGCDNTGFIPYEEKMYKVKEFKTYTRPPKPQEKTNKDKLYEYFGKRKISKETLEHYQIGINDNNEIIFPYYKNELLVNIKHRTNLGEGRKSFRQQKNAEKTFFGVDLIPNVQDELIIVEGEVDVLSFYEAGYYAVSVPQGASEKKLECIDNCFAFISSFKSFILAVDDDKAGHVLKENLIERLGKASCKIINWKKYGDIKDCNEALVLDKEIIHKAVLQAEYLELSGIETISANREKIIEFHKNGYKSGISTGWKSLDKIFTIKPKHLMIITGIPTRGKSFFADNLLYNLTISQGWKHLICSMENTFENHFARFAQFYKGKQFRGDSGNEISRQELDDCMDFFDEHVYRFSIEKSWSIDEIIQYGEYAVKRYGIKTLTIDPYNRLNNDFNEREDKYIDSLLAKLSVFARKNDVLVIFVAHPKKLGRDENVPNLYSISGGASWYNMADYGIVIHREKIGDRLCNTPEVIVQKVKDFHIGEPSGGSVKLQYSSTRHILEEIIDIRKTWN